MNQYEYSGGKVRRNIGSLYVERKEDETIIRQLREGPGLIYVTAPRQTGKTSMVCCIGEQLATENYKYIFIDFRLFSNPTREIIESYEGEWWFNSLFHVIAGQLDVDDDTFMDWETWVSKKKMAPVHRFVDFCRHFLHEKLEKPVLVVFDELDRFGEWGYFTDDFFRAIQLLHEERNQLNISFLLASISHPALLQKGNIISDFKEGVHISLPDFDVSDESIRKWTVGLVGVDDTERLAVGREVLQQTGGHPFLTSFLMHQFNQLKGTTAADVAPLVDELVVNAANPDLSLPLFRAPRDFIGERERYAFAVLDAYRNILEGPIDITDIDDRVLAVLDTTGLVKIVEKRKLDVRSPIFRRIFDKKWSDRTESGMGSRDWYSPLKIPSYSRKLRPAICLINTGGTQGMVERGNKMVSPLNEKEFFDSYPALRIIADIDYVPFTTKDGANMFPGDWAKIARAIYKRRNDGYDGFVIVHGTDTMCYTASAVAFALGSGLRHSVVFVGSQTPYNVPHGDALANLSRACMIASKKIPEVVISFGDEVYRAVRAQKYNDYLFRGFYSPTFKPLAVITEEIEIQQDSLWIDETKRMECIDKFDDRVLQIGQYPGFDAEWLQMILESDTVRGIIIESLGIGNLPTLSGSKYNLLPMIEYAINQKHIPVVITSRYPINPEFTDKYTPATAPLIIGAISAGNMTSSAALTKLMWLLPKVEADIKKGDVKEKDKLEELAKLMAQSIVGEVDKIKIYGAET